METEIWVQEIWEIRQSDINPDTGFIEKDSLLSIAFTEANAEMLKSSVEFAYQAAEANPNREFYLVKKDLKL